MSHTCVEDKENLNKKRKKPDTVDEEDERSMPRVWLFNKPHGEGKRVALTSDRVETLGLTSSDVEFMYVGQGLPPPARKMRAIEPIGHKTMNKALDLTATKSHPPTTHSTPKQIIEISSSASSSPPTSPSPLVLQASSNIPPTVRLTNVSPHTSAPKTSFAHSSSQGSSDVNMDIATSRILSDLSVEEEREIIDSMLDKWIAEDVGNEAKICKLKLVRGLIGVALGY
ncbi:hypothetical protein SISSUDRAFT_1064980 [Sistotremastrum suecicum HHB10207 ss-3]|uniref:Uncharacterized protein n=1 Tax=Sistotremastrum suecicum HHB10207 ss-3 TaxID=1314776 RepID=A0A166A101_9AGAM|nr:hypothetical protein SISSUDRAFT_1064980 [Sistotremastrum suecicum HHB10207 ss-3]